MHITAVSEDFLESRSKLQSCVWCTDDLQHFTRRSMHFMEVWWIYNAEHIVKGNPAGMPPHDEWPGGNPAGMPPHGEWPGREPSKHAPA